MTIIDQNRFIFLSISTVCSSANENDLIFVQDVFHAIRFSQTYYFFDKYFDEFLDCWTFFLQLSISSTCKSK